MCAGDHTRTKRSGVGRQTRSKSELRDEEGGPVYRSEHTHCSRRLLHFCLDALGGQDVNKEAWHEGEAGLYCM